MDYTQLASRDSADKTGEALKARGIETIFVENRGEALAKIKELIAGGASVMNGSSRTLEEIGFVEHLKSGEHGWNNLHADILAESDKQKQSVLRKQSVLSDYYLGSVHALAETGEILIASNSGSQLPHIVYTSPNLIFVVGAQKITPNLDSAMRRLYEYVLPLEDQRMKDAGNSGSYPSKIVIFNREPKFTGRKVTVILVNEKLGF